MSLKTEKKSEAQAQPQDTIILELALYTNYTFRGIQFQKGVQYKFKREDALNLLSERDAERPVWKIYRPKLVKVERPKIEDQTAIEVPPPAEPIPGTPPARLDIGTEEELAEILADKGDAADNVTV